MTRFACNCLPQNLCLFTYAYMQHVSKLEGKFKNLGIYKVFGVETEKPQKVQLLQGAWRDYARIHREIVPVCALHKVRNWYLNPVGTPYMGHK